MSPDLPSQYSTYPRAVKFQENNYVSGQQSKYIRCYTPFASLYVATACKSKIFFALLLNSKASLQVFTASYINVLKIQVK